VLNREVWVLPETGAMMFAFLIFYFARYSGKPPPNKLADVVVEMILPIGPKDKRLRFYTAGFC